MGIFTKVNGRNSKNGSVNDGGHNIDGNAAMKQTDAAAITPNTPGAFESIRSFPVCKNPRYFTKEETEAVEQLAVQKAAGAMHAKRAFKNMERVEVADTVVHKAHKEYLGTVALTETAKIAANGKLAQKLHALRPAYAQVAEGIDQAQKQADYAIAARTGRIIAAKK